MMSWLVMHIFGNGHGTGAPYFDTKAYWLVDTQDLREHGTGHWYMWIGGAGAQLQSFEWRAPKPGTQRRLAGRTFRVFNVSRGYIKIPFFGGRLEVIPCMWSVSWASIGVKSIDEIRRMEKSLGNPLAPDRVAE